MNNPYYFDLDKAIASWRRTMAYNRAFTDDDLDELEQHVRDQVDGLRAQGLAKQEAFRQTMREMGDYSTAEAEYRKVYWGKRRRRRQLLSELTWRFSMLTNYLKVALRTLLRQKGYTFINIAGLTMGLACCILIFQFVAFETSFDAFHETADRIYRIAITETRSGEEPRTSALVGFGAGPAFAEETPEIVRYTRIQPDFFQEGPTVSYKEAGAERTFKEQRAFFADSTLLSMFTYRLVQGDPTTAMRQPQTLLLTETTARKYFGSENPVGKTLEYTSPNISGTYMVAGVLADVPANSHLQFDVLLPVHAFFDEQDPLGDYQWGRDNNYRSAYVELRAGADVAEVERKLTDVLYRHTGDDIRARNAVAAVQLQPLQSVHLDVDTDAGRIETSDPKTVYFFSIIALVTLAIALVNYVNLSTARAVDRAKEVGVRKVVGAQRKQLIGQFLLESVLTNLAGLLLALGLAALLLPVVNRLIGTQLSLVAWGSGPFLTASAGALVIGVLLSGFYPAFVLSSFRPARVLKGKATSFASRVNLRKGLVVVQFTASVLLLIGTGVVYSQLNYMRQLDVGLDLDQVLMVTSPRVLPEGMESRTAEHSFREEVRKLPAVTGAAFSGNMVGDGFVDGGPARLDTADPSAARDVWVTAVDHDFTEVYSIDLVAGEQFREGMPSWFVGPRSVPRPALINETAVQTFGLASNEAALNQIIMQGSLRYVVLGVLEDFNWSSAHRPAEPVLFRHNPTNRFLSLKVSTANLAGTIAAVRETFEAMFPGNSFEYHFADAVFDAQYQDDKRFAALFGVFAGLAILIACLGLLGLVSFTAARRSKEIGIRKVLGASVINLVSLLSADFLKLVGIAFLLAAPLAYFGMQQWLDNFAYRIEIGPGVFVTAGALALAIALLTVSYQSIKAALANPVKSLRYE